MPRMLGNFIFITRAYYYYDWNLFFKNDFKRWLIRFVSMYWTLTINDHKVLKDIVPNHHFI